MILSDPAGEGGVRRIRWFERHEPDGGSQPAPRVRRAGRRARRRHTGDARPVRQCHAARSTFRRSAGRSTWLARTAGAMPLVGSDFQLADLFRGAPRDFTYEREADAEIDRSVHYVIRATPVKERSERTGGGCAATTCARATTSSCARNFHDARGVVARRQSFRDAREVESGVWQADMILMEDFGERHRTLLKVERRVFSPDYAPAEIFSRQWLAEGRDLLDRRRRAVRALGRRARHAAETARGRRRTALRPRPVPAGAHRAGGLGRARGPDRHRLRPAGPPQEADRQTYQRVTREFGSDNRTIVYVRDAALWTPAKLAALERPAPHARGAARGGAHRRPLHAAQPTQHRRAG